MTDRPARSRRKVPESPGERLQRSIRSLYELDPGEDLLLDEAAAVADALDRLNREVAATSLTEAGSKGQPVASPLLTAQRQHAETLARLLAALALPDLGEEQGETLATRQARRAAQARWAKQKKGAS